MNEENSAIIIDKRDGFGEGLAVEKVGDDYYLLDFYDSGVMCQSYSLDEILTIMKAILALEA